MLRISSTLNRFRGITNLVQVESSGTRVGKGLILQGPLISQNLYIYVQFISFILLSFFLISGKLNHLKLNENKRKPK
jgi:hypothetical protein